jgi:hypothetical protein
LTNLQPADAGQYRLAASNAFGSNNVSLEFVVGVTNAAGGVTSAPVDLIDPVPSIQGDTTCFSD